MILSLYILALKIIVDSLASSKGDQELFKYNFMSSWMYMFYAFQFIVMVIFIDSWFTFSLASERLFNLTPELFRYKPGSFAGFLLFGVIVCCTFLPRLGGQPFSRRLASSKSLHRGAGARQSGLDWDHQLQAAQLWTNDGDSYFFIKDNGSIYRELVGRLRKEDRI